MPDATSYLHRVMLESMRIDPPAWGFDRRVLAADSVGGYPVPKGSFIFLSPYVTHRHPEYWPDAEKFDPSRFETEKVEARPRYAYIPFGAGPRACIGQHFALTEMKVILATLLRKGKIDILNGEKIRRDPSVTLRPRTPIFATFTT